MLQSFLGHCGDDRRLRVRRGEGGAGALGEIRTPDPQIRSLVLYPAELRAPLKRGRVRRWNSPRGGQKANKTRETVPQSVPVRI
jgi:hypothetical protein